MKEPKVTKDTVRVDMSVDEAETRGHHLYDYTLTYTINGAKFKRHFRTGKEARSYQDILVENQIITRLTAKRMTGGAFGPTSYTMPIEVKEP